MTLLTKAFDIFGRLYTRFKIEPGTVTTEQPSISTQIIPVTQVDALLTSPRVQFESNDITAAAGAFLAYFTVPAGKRWRAKRFQRFGTTGSSALMVQIAGTAVLLVNTGTSGEAINLDIVLDQDDALGLRTTGNGADSSVRSDLVYEEEDAF